MAAVVWKYPLSFTDGIQKVEMPYGARILHADVQDPDEIGASQFHLWAQVDDEEDIRQERSFCIVGTGWKMPKDNLSDFKHVSTMMVRNGAFVWHVFEVND